VREGTLFNEGLLIEDVFIDYIGWKYRYIWKRDRGVI